MFHNQTSVIFHWRLKSSLLSKCLLKPSSGRSCKRYSLLCCHWLTHVMSHRNTSEGPWHGLMCEPLIAAVNKQAQPCVLDFSLLKSFLFEKWYMTFSMSFFCLYKTLISWYSVCESAFNKSIVNDCLDEVVLNFQAKQDVQFQTKCFWLSVKSYYWATPSHYFRELYTSVGIT